MMAPALRRLHISLLPALGRPERGGSTRWMEPHTPTIARVMPMEIRRWDSFSATNASQSEGNLAYSYLTDLKALVCILLTGCQAVLAAPTGADTYLSPTALVATEDGKTLYIAGATAKQVLGFNTAKREVSCSIPMPQAPSGLALSADHARLFVTCAAPESEVCVIDLNKSKVVETMSAGHTALAPVISPDCKTLYVCNRFNNNVSVIDLVAGKEVRRIAVQREPVAAGITRDGKYLLVANHLPLGRADVAYVSAVVSVIDLAAGKVSKELQLPNGSASLKDLRVSPDGKYAAVTHLAGRFNRITTQLNYGWMNVNAMTLIDLAGMEIVNTLLLDNVDRGAPNPWGMAFSSDGAALVITHAGTHEMSVVDFPNLVAHLLSLRATASPGQAIDPNLAFQAHPELADDLPFLAGARQRVKLATNDLGPRAVVVVGHTAYVANYFSDTLSAVDLSAPRLAAESIPLGPKREMDVVRKGEFYFHDARICLQTWQSCSSCHPGEARVDGLNWDLLNDGTGNPKNTKSLLLAHRTPPAMSLGIRADARAAVRSGIQHILFTTQAEEVPAAIDEYLKSLQTVPSPHLVHGKPSEAAKRGEAVFSRAGCAECHPPPIFTDLRQYEVGTRRSFDKPGDKFDTPTLIEVWRTAPYLHDGSAVTVRDFLTTRNRHDRHGKTSALTNEELEDLCAYVLSL
jgi:YVTN family beta-propeller protein